jgi:hypothetical protein
VRGRWPDGHLPVRKCNACGAGIIMRLHLLPRRTEATAIPSDTWARMEAEWDRSFSPEAEPATDSLREAEPVALVGHTFPRIIKVYVRARKSEPPDDALDTALAQLLNSRDLGVVKSFFAGALDHQLAAIDPDVDGRTARVALIATLEEYNPHRDYAVSAGPGFLRART